MIGKTCSLDLMFLLLMSISSIYAINEDRIAREFSEAFTAGNLDIVLIETVDDCDLLNSERGNSLSIKAFERYLYAGHPIVFFKRLDSVKGGAPMYFAYVVPTPSRGGDIIPAVGKLAFLPDVGTKWVAVVDRKTENVGGFNLLKITDLHSGLVPYGHYAPISTSGQSALNDMSNIYQAFDDSSINGDFIETLESRFGAIVVKQLLIK